MAWIRTCLSLISFGFGLDKIIDAIRSQGDGVGHAQLGVRLISMGFVATGIVALAGATLQYQREVRRLQHDDFTYRHSRSIATWTALVITLIGVVALLMIAAGGLPA
jgi:putative membrane protein